MQTASQRIKVCLAYIHVHTDRHTHIHTYIHVHTCTYMYIHTYIHTYRHTYIHTYIHTYTHTYTHTRTHTHTHTILHRSPYCLIKHDVLGILLFFLIGYFGCGYNISTDRTLLGQLNNSLPGLISCFNNSLNLLVGLSDLLQPQHDLTESEITASLQRFYERNIVMNNGINVCR